MDMGDGVSNGSGSCSTNPCSKRRKSIFRYIADSISAFVPSGMFTHAVGDSATDTELPVSRKSDRPNGSHSCCAAPPSSVNCQYTSNVARPVVNVDLDAGESSDADLSAHSSTSGVSSLLPKNFLAAKVGDFLTQSSRSASTQIPRGYTSGTSSDVLDSVASTSTYCCKPVDKNTSLSSSRDLSFFSKPAKRLCPSDYHSENGLASEKNTSMFYRSRTTYGGAASCRPLISSQKSLNSTVPLRFELEPQINASHSNGTSNGTNLSSTARRILESLERFSTPLASAERIPLPLSETPRRQAVIAKSFRTHRFPPYALAYNRMKAAERKKYQSSSTADVTLFHSPMIRCTAQTTTLTTTTQSCTTPTLTSSVAAKGINFAFQNLAPLTAPKVSYPSTTPVGSTCGQVVSSTTTCLVDHNVDHSKNCTFSFATPIRRPTSVAAQLALMQSNGDSATTFTFSFPTRLTSSVSTSSVPNLSYGNAPTSTQPQQFPSQSTSSVTSPIFDLIVCPPQTSTHGLSVGNRKAFTTAPAIKSINVNTWRCVTCLLENVDSINSCTVCSTPRVTEVTSGSSLVTSTDSTSVISATTVAVSDATIWMCSTCSKCNKSTCSSCIGCGAAKTQTSSSTSFTSPLLLASNTTSKWECPTCMVYNDKDKVACLCCQTPNPSGSKTDVSKVNTANKFSFLSPVSSTDWDCPTCMVQNTADTDKCPCCATKKSDVPSGVSSASFPVASSTGLSTVVTSVSASPLVSNTNSKWECPTCMVYNDKDKIACPCCQTPNPSGSKTDVSKVNTANKFSFLTPISSIDWDCPTCMVQNTADTDKCPCCATKKPVVESGVSQAISSTVPNNAATSTNTSTPVFSSGSSIRFGFPTTSTDTVSTRPLSVFSTNSRTSGSSTNESSAVSDTKPPPVLGFGSFTFGVTNTQEAVVSTSSNPISSSKVFTFGSTQISAPSVTESCLHNGANNPLGAGNASSLQSTPFKLFGESGTSTTAANNGVSLPVHSSSGSSITFAPPSSAVYQFGSISPLPTLAVAPPTFSVPSFSGASSSTTTAVSATKSAFVFGTPSTSTAVFSQSQTVQPLFGQSTPTPFVFGSASATSVMPSSGLANPVFCFSGPIANHNLFTTSNAPTLGIGQNPGGNIFSAASSSSTVPRKKVHATRRLHR